MATPEEVRYRERDDVVDVLSPEPGQNPKRFSSNQQGGQGGGQGSGQSGGSSNGSSGGNSGSGSGGSSGGQGAGMNNQRMQQPREQPQREQAQSQPQSQSQSQPQSQSKEPSMHSYCPPAYAILPPTVAPFGAYSGGYGAGYGVGPGAGAPVTTVVTGGRGDNDSGHGISNQIETLADIAVGNLRESAANGRFAGVTNQIEGIGDRLDTQAGFARELHVQREFTAAQKDRGDLENRLLTAIKDESIRTRDMFTDQRIRELETRNADLRDARRDDRMIDALNDIKKKIGA